MLDVLSGSQASDAAEIYAAALPDEDPNVVITAVENLGGIRAEEFRSQIEDLLQADSHPMLVAACLEALVGIGEESSLAAIRRRFPDLATVPDFFLALLLESPGRSGIRQRVRRSGQPAAAARPSPAPRDSQRTDRHFAALPVAGPRWEFTACICGQWLMAETRRCAATRRCGPWAFGPLATTFTASWFPGCRTPSAWFAWGRQNPFGGLNGPGCSRFSRRGLSKNPTRRSCRP